MFRENRTEKLITLGTLCFALFMTLLDATVVNVALPTISADLHAGGSSLQWVADAYTLALATCLLTGGTLGARFGHKRMFLIGLATFTVGSIGSGIAPSIGALIASRGLQGVGAAILLPSTLAILAPTFPDKRERAAAIGIWAGVSGIALAAGPLIGGALVDSGSWRAVFFINVPVGIVASLIAVHTIRETPISARGLDIAGQVAALAGLGSLTYALIDGAARSWTSPLILGLFVLGVSAMAAFVAIERRVRAPMLQLSMFRSATISSALVLRVLLGFALFGTLFFASLYFQDVLGYTPLEAGVRWIPMTAAIALMAPIAGRLAGRTGTRALVTVGMVFMAVGVTLFSTATATSSYGSFWWHMVLFGIGVGLCITPLTAVVMNAVPDEQAGMASATVSSAQQTGSVFGIAILGVVVTGRLETTVRTGVDALSLTGAQKASLLSTVSQDSLGVVPLPPAERAATGPLIARGFVDGMQAGMRITGVLLAAGAFVALALLPSVTRSATSSSSASRSLALKQP
jgi:EmrB/QacA subfamily drug resistance transporter